ncbi:uracil-DNA glycosylase [Myroides injenensis]|uniref:uracil-DNA glycosylase n=1 Tax=Myroides injenensis TaxID=1183151 RepID=UPI00055C05E8|nr:uracil-DNA glycosylase [Myroides injenensis]
MIEISKSLDWYPILQDELKKEYYLKLIDFLGLEYNSKIVYPPKEDIFKALELTSFENTKVVILGQDPYHGPFQANGLSFSVGKGVKNPPSLVNIFKELESDLGVKNGKTGDLTKWAEQGVLLLNATLTVLQKSPGSHQKRGWEQFTDTVIEKLASQREGIVFILWGSYAQKKGKNIDRNRHYVIETAHPSPLSVYRGFYDSKPFSKTNEYLKSIGKTPIDWSL